MESNEVKPDWLKIAREHADKARDITYQAQDTPVSDAILHLHEAVTILIAQLEARHE